MAVAMSYNFAKKRERRVHISKMAARVIITNNIYIKHILFLIHKLYMLEVYTNA